MATLKLTNLTPSGAVVGIQEENIADIGTRPLDAWGDVEKVVMHDYLAAEWTVTATGTSPITPSVLPGARALVTTGANEYDGDNMQWVGSRFKLTSGQPFHFHAKITLGEATQSDFVVGLCGVDTTLTNASASHALAIGAGGFLFSKLDGVTGGFAKTFSTATEKNSAAAFVADTSAHSYDIVYANSVLNFYYDNALVASFSTDLTTEVLTPSINYRAGSAGAKTLTIHELRAFQYRS